MFCKTEQLSDVKRQKIKKVRTVGVLVFMSEGHRNVLSGCQIMFNFNKVVNISLLFSSASCRTLEDRASSDMLVAAVGYEPTPRRDW